MKLPLKILGISAIALASLCLIGLLVIGNLSPETFIYTEKQIPKRFLKTVKSLGLLEEDETIQYFYSDGFLKIEQGMYFVTDKNLTLYSTEWPEPSLRIPLNELFYVEAEFNDSFFEDSYVTIASNDIEYAFFPLSSERGLDKKFVEYLEKHANENVIAIEHDEEPAPSPAPE